jgi:hypothetical protein
MSEENTFEAQIQAIKTEILKKVGPAASIRTLGKQEALPSDKTIRNLRSLRKIPQDIFFLSPNGILADTARFLEWWGSRCSRLGGGAVND